MICRIRFLPNDVEVSVPSGTLLLHAAKIAGVYLDAPCGGNGTCGKCEVSLSIEGTTSRVLACQTRVVQDCTVTLSNAGQLNTLHEGKQRSVAFLPCTSVGEPVDGACIAAFDLGTTSIVCYLLDGRTGEELVSCGMQNPQAAYGADVIARANYALTSGEPDALRDCAIAALNDLILRVTK